MSQFKAGQDPYWLVARYAGKAKDGTSYAAGTRVFWYPNSKTALVGEAAERAAAAFESARADESFETGNW